MLENRVFGQAVGGGTQKVVPIMLITPKGGQHNELEAA